MDINQYSGSEYVYEFLALPTLGAEEEVATYCATTRSLFAPIAKQFDDSLNTEWVVRHYLAVKYIFAASITLGSAIYGEQKNIRSTLPYCVYYAMLYCCRAYLFTVPDFEWKGLASIQKTHSSILNLTENHLKRLSPTSASRWAAMLKTAQEHRELYSYRFPTTGLALIKDSAIDLNAATELCQLLSDLAKLNSDCLESSLRKHNPGDFKIVVDDIEPAMTYQLGGIGHHDPDDYQRMYYHIRKFSTVSNLSFVATEGLRDDYFGNWTADDGDDKDAFDPDQYMYLLLS